MRKINSVLIDGTVLKIKNDETTSDVVQVELVNAPIIKRGRISVDAQTLDEHRFFVDIPKSLLKKTELELKVGNELRIVGYIKPAKVFAEHIALV